MPDEIKEKMANYKDLSLDELTARIISHAPGHFTVDELASADIRVLRYCCAMLDLYAAK